MTETFTIGRDAAPSPFREDLVAEAEGFTAPQEPEYSSPGEPMSETLLDEAYAAPAEEALLEGEDETPSTTVQGQSAIAVQAARQWDSVDRPAGWIGKVYGLVVHTTGGGLPSKAKAKGIYHTAFAVSYYSQSHGCHYVNGWRGVAGGDLLQVANEREQANGVGVGDQRRSIDQGRFEKDLPAAVVTQWRARWPGVEHPLKLLPGTRTANSCYIHVECVPCVFHHGKQLVTDATPLRPGLRFTQAQHEAVALLACDIARRNGWPLHETWWRSARLVGHEDLTPFNRHDKAGGWDPGGMRAVPYFDWDFVHSMIERECRRTAAPTASRPSWWPFSEAEDDELEQPGDALEGEGEWEVEPESEQEPESESEQEGEWETEQEGEWEGGDPLEEAYGAGLEGELEDESSFLEPFRLAMAIARGQRDEKALTNGVFFARHPELGGRPIAPGERTLASEWVTIRDTLVRPLLARASQPTTTGSGAGGALPPGPFGTLVLNAPGRTPFSYPFTAEDAAWTAKLVVLEAGGRPDADSAAVVWAMFNRYALVRHTLYPTFHSFIRAYSTTLQPVLLNWRAAQRHLDSPEFVPSGGTYTTKGAPPGIPKGQLRRHLAFQAQGWDRLPAGARTLTLQAVRGSLPNPGIGLASEFVSTRILWMQANSTKREPTEQEWRSFTENFPARVKKPYAWIGDVPAIDQRKNAFFRYAVDASLPPDAVTVTP
ncbi:N-acetylmuramoyl-L-alanine amidase [Nocardioides sp.]|uniref:peptidoglycan recognition protein family protein n=1 Tax=Nocardioides sp. TaxID=35761 RepID=UPI0035B2C74B